MVAVETISSAAAKHVALALSQAHFRGIKILNNTPVQ
jgi:hypothetical protein